MREAEEEKGGAIEGKEGGGSEGKANLGEMALA
jgi:hypothetical protein